MCHGNVTTTRQLRIDSPSKLNFSCKGSAARRRILIGLLFKHIHHLLTQFSLNLFEVSIEEIQNFQMYLNSSLVSIKLSTLLAYVSWKSLRKYDFASKLSFFLFLIKLSVQEKIEFVMCIPFRLMPLCL